MDFAIITAIFIGSTAVVTPAVFYFCNYYLRARRERFGRKKFLRAYDHRDTQMFWFYMVPKMKYEKEQLRLRQQKEKQAAAAH